MAGVAVCHAGALLSTTHRNRCIKHLARSPLALLGNYNVFPEEVANARSEDILNALDAAYADGFDVANMSLGGGAHGTQDLLTIAVDNLDRANMVVAVAAGNSGPGHYTVESLGSAACALTAGAASVGHFVGAPLTIDSATYNLATGEFNVVSSDLTANLAVLPRDAGTNTPPIGRACGPVAGVAGKIAVISRGICSFTTKIRNAQNAGAVAAIVVNNVAGDPVAMAADGTLPAPLIPAYMAGRGDRAALIAANGASATIGATLAYFLTGNDDIMAGFSSQGPTDVDFRMKPDVVAPGVNVLSSIPMSYCGGSPCFAFFQGTSMATPHLAGSAAVLRWASPGLTAAEIRSAIVNTADQGVLKNFTTEALERDVLIAGAGRENLLSAVEAAVALDPVSVSFGAVPSGSGQARGAGVTVKNLSGDTLTLRFAVDDTTGPDGNTRFGVGFAVAPASVTLAAGESAQIGVTMSADKGAAAGDKQAWLRVKSGGTEIAHAALYTYVK